MTTGAFIRSDSKLAREFWETGKSDSCPVIDIHGHMGPWHSIYFPRCEPQDMVRSMDAAGVRLLVFAHHASLLAPEVRNTPAIEAVRRFPDRLRAYAAVNPHYPEFLAEDIATFDDYSDVFVGLKFLADYHRVAITDDAYRPALEFANARKLPILCHTWRDSPFDGPDCVRKVAGEYPDATFFLAHCFNNDWETAVAVAKERPNVYLDLTSVVGIRGVIEFFCQEVTSTRVLYGTDLPWFDEHHYIGGVLSADITDDDRHNILHHNAERILGL